MRSHARGACLAAALACAWLAVPSLAAQSVLDHPPDLLGTWVGEPGTLYFDLVHRFKTTGGTADKVLNSPTFLLGTALPGHTMIGARYASNSLLVSGRPNESEFFGRWAPVEQLSGAPMDAAVHAGYNDASRSWDGELTLARAVGPVRLFGVGRTFSAFRGGTGRSAVGGGFTLRLNQFVALAGDAVTLVDRRANEEVAWSAGLQLGVPYTPHTLALTVSNANTTTLEGASLGVPQGRRWGFEYSIPIALSRYFGGRIPDNASAPAMGLALLAGGSIGAEVHLTNQFQFVPDTVRIKAGQSVLWINGSTLIHTVTADARLAQLAGDGRLPAGAKPFNSGFLSPGKVFEHVFRVPGEYHYFCIPHEASGMRGTIIVE